VPGFVQAGGCPGERAGDYRHLALRRPDTEGEHDGQPSTANDQLLRIGGRPYADRQERVKSSRTGPMIASAGT
jgi:hypothetical protein